MNSVQYGRNAHCGSVLQILKWHSPTLFCQGVVCLLAPIHPFANGQIVKNGHVTHDGFCALQ